MIAIPLTRIVGLAAAESLRLYFEPLRTAFKATSALWRVIGRGSTTPINESIVADLHSLSARLQRLESHYAAHHDSVRDSVLDLNRSLLALQAQVEELRSRLASASLAKPSARAHRVSADDVELAIERVLARRAAGIVKPSEALAEEHLEAFRHLAAHFEASSLEGYAHLLPELERKYSYFTLYWHTHLTDPFRVSPLDPEERLQHAVEHLSAIAHLSFSHLGERPIPHRSEWPFSKRPGLLRRLFTSRW